MCCLLCVDCCVLFVVCDCGLLRVVFVLLCVVCCVSCVVCVVCCFCVLSVGCWLLVVVC